MKEHFENLQVIPIIPNCTKILDAGSGKTSLSYLVYNYPHAQIDAVVFPNDERKIHSIHSFVKGNFSLLELDLCKQKLHHHYDLVLAHLLLGEATKFHNSFKDLFHNLMKISSTYFLIYDFLEDPTIDYTYLENYLNKHSFVILKKEFFLKQCPQEFGDFIGEHYILYFLEKRQNIN